MARPEGQNPVETVGASLGVGRAAFHSGEGGGVRAGAGKIIVIRENVADSGGRDPRLEFLDADAEPPLRASPPSSKRFQEIERH